MAEFAKNCSDCVWPGGTIFATQGGDWQFPNSSVTGGSLSALYNWTGVPGTPVNSSVTGQLATFTEYYDTLLNATTALTNFTLFAENYYTGLPCESAAAQNRPLRGRAIAHRRRGPAVHFGDLERNKSANAGITAGEDRGWFGTTRPHDAPRLCYWNGVRPRVLCWWLMWRSTVPRQSRTAHRRGVGLERPVVYVQPNRRASKRCHEDGNGSALHRRRVEP
jgi:hypothetical protein